mmetsp:Transcript_37301/g.73882  ORF Transcript_37301/g.73882 Transcript_37301/m.73882 type:complete len:216 (-) Transcript_37301:997-1644(-)
MADSCARPHALTSWDVAMLPVPMPTRRPSTPASSKCLACSSVATLPPITSHDEGKCCLSHATHSTCAAVSPCLESTTTTSHPASAKAKARVRYSRTASADCFSCTAFACAAWRGLTGPLPLPPPPLLTLLLLPPLTLPLRPRPPPLTQLSRSSPLATTGLPVASSEVSASLERSPREGKEGRCVLDVGTGSWMAAPTTNEKEPLPCARPELSALG